MTYSNCATASSKQTQQTLNEITLPEVHENILDFAPYAEDFIDYYYRHYKKPPLRLKLTEIEKFLDNSIFAKFYNDLSILTKQNLPDIIDYELYIRVMNAVLHENYSRDKYEILQQIKSQISEDVYELFLILFYFASSTQDGYSSTTKLGAVMANFWQIDYKKVLQCKIPLCIEGDCIDLELGIEWIFMIYQSIGKK